MILHSRELGICKGATCNIEGNQPVERYPGPGMFCPKCGEVLQRYVADVEPPVHKTVMTKDSAPPPPPSENGTPAAPTASRNGVPRRALVGAAVVAAVLLVAAGVRFIVTAGNYPVAGAVGVCGSSMTQRLARDMVGGYAMQTRTSPNHFEVRETACDVTFATERDVPARRLAGPQVIGHDGVVVIVNPQNPVAQMNLRQLRGILAGDIPSWAMLGGSNAHITVYLPDRSSVESQLISTAILQGAPFGSGITRLRSSDDVVRAVTAANGSNAIGVVAFSAAVPGKVVGIQTYPTPSVLSIGQRLYPLSLNITVMARRTADRAAFGLVSYATSPGAQTVAARDGVVP